MTLNRFFSLFLFSSLFIYFGINPYVIDQKELEDIPQLEFSTFVSYEIEGENLNMMVVGEGAKRYANKLVLKDFVLYQESNNSVSMISAIDGITKPKEVLLSHSVQYKSKDGILLESEEARLDKKRNTLEINVPFRLTQNGSVITGTSLLFNQNNDKIVAKDVRSSLDIQ